MDVILDVDAGVDDALAILLALRSPLRVRAITCVPGNVDVDQVTANTLKVLDAAAAPDIPVGCGSGPAPSPRDVHGQDGMADLGLPESRRSVAGTAAEVVQSALSDGPAVLLALGPLTNVAAMLSAPARRNIDRLICVGGPGLEFNLEYDPEATDAVVRSDLPLTTYGADEFYSTTVPDAEIDRLLAATDPAVRLAGRLLRHQAKRFGADRATLGDAGAIAALLTDGDAAARTRCFLDHFTSRD